MSRGVFADSQIAAFASLDQAAVRQAAAVGPVGPVQQVAPPMVATICHLLVDRVVVLVLKVVAMDHDLVDRAAMDNLVDRVADHQAAVSVATTSARRAVDFLHLADKEEDLRVGLMVDLPMEDHNRVVQKATVVNRTLADQA
jgi:hypothetical protein